MAAALRNKKGPNGRWTCPLITRPLDAGVEFLRSARCSIMKGFHEVLSDPKLWGLQIEG